MKNILLLIFFSIISLLSLAVLIILAILPKLCCCFTSFCNKNYKTIKKQNTRARRIKRARLRVLYKSQITKEKPIQIELDRSEGLFFDEESKQRVKDEGSLESYYSGQYKTSLASGLKHNMISWLVSLSRTLSNSMHHLSDVVGTYSKVYFGQLRSYVTSSLTKYLNH